MNRINEADQTMLVDVDGVPQWRAFDMLTRGSSTFSLASATMRPGPAPVVGPREQATQMVDGTWVINTEPG